MTTHITAATIRADFALIQLLLAAHVSSRPDKRAIFELADSALRGGFPSIMFTIGTFVCGENFDTPLSVEDEAGHRTAGMDEIMNWVETYQDRARHILGAIAADIADVTDEKLAAFLRVNLTVSVMGARSHNVTGV